ncbi:hypothetical protein HDA36_005183 [Nocardiopsis composta]|uniref:Uncharacterized protein n=1 Tax=Nocardiopsis composta TaxID=157465 RepID=A0A7W8VGL7_9ACTN|nr:hypothetical protein [Nocardiopsis composta]
MCDRPPSVFDRPAPPPRPGRRGVGARPAAVPPRRSRGHRPVRRRSPVQVRGRSVPQRPRDAPAAAAAASSRIPGGAGPAAAGHPGRSTACPTVAQAGRLPSAGSPPQRRNATRPAPARAAARSGRRWPGSAPAPFPCPRLPPPPGRPCAAPAAHPLIPAHRSATAAREGRPARGARRRRAGRRPDRKRAPAACRRPSVPAPPAGHPPRRRRRVPRCERHRFLCERAAGNPAPPRRPGRFPPAGPAPLGRGPEARTGAGRRSASMGGEDRTAPLCRPPSPGRRRGAENTAVVPLRPESGSEARGRRGRRSAGDGERCAADARAGPILLRPCPAHARGADADVPGRLSIGPVRRRSGPHRSPGIFAPPPSAPTDPPGARFPFGPWDPAAARPRPRRRARERARRSSPPRSKATDPRSSA